jgi:hypothetical protein
MFNKGLSPYGGSDDSTYFLRRRPVFSAKVAHVDEVGLGHHLALAVRYFSATTAPR